MRLAMASKRKKQEGEKSRGTIGVSLTPMRRQAWEELALAAGRKAAELARDVLETHMAFYLSDRKLVELGMAVTHGSRERRGHNKAVLNLVEQHRAKTEAKPTSNPEGKIAAFTVELERLKSEKQPSKENNPTLPKCQGA